MNFEEYQANSGAEVFSKQCDLVSDPLNQTACSSMILENLSDDDDIMSVNNFQDTESRNEPLRMEDATDSKLDEKMDQLLKILDETITILGAGVDEDDDCDHYILADQNGKREDRNVQNEAALDNTVIIKPNLPNNDTVGRESEAKDFSVTENLQGKCDGLNELTESCMIALMLFSLFVLLSSLI